MSDFQQASREKLIAALEAVGSLCEQGFMVSPEQIRQAITAAVA